MKSAEQCPCGSGTDFSACCGPLLAGQRQAASAVELMRSRYTAYVKAEVDYLFATTHPDHRQGYDHQGTKTWAKEAEWEGLEIVATERGGAAESEGTVEFIARYREKGGLITHHELGHFLQDDGRWFFTDGKQVKPRPLISTKIGRNDPCPCGSGSKYKKCCGA